MRSVRTTKPRLWSRRLAVLGAVLTLGVWASAPAFGQAKFELGQKGFEKLEQPEPGTPAGQLYKIRQALAEDQHDRAWTLANQWIEQHPNHPRRPEAYLLRGDAKAAQQRFYDALFDYEHVVRNFPGSEQFRTALERELRIAEAFGRGIKRRLWGMRVLPAYGEAEEIMIRVQERAPGTRLAERAGIELADFYYHRSEMKNAADAYDLFLQNYPDSQWRQHAMRRQVLANLARFKGPRFDPTGLLEAESRLQDYQQQYPAAAEQIGADALLTRIDETLARRLLMIGRWYQDREKDVAAEFTYQQLIKDHPGSAAAREALDRLKSLAPQRYGDVTTAKEAIEKAPAQPRAGSEKRARSGESPDTAEPDADQPEEEPAEPEGGEALSPPEPSVTPDSAGGGGP